MAPQLLEERGMIFKSEKRRLVGGNVPVIRAAIYGIPHSHAHCVLHPLIQQIALRSNEQNRTLPVQDGRSILNLLGNCRV